MSVQFKMNMGIRLRGRGRGGRGRGRKGRGGRRGRGRRSFVGDDDGSDVDMGFEAAISPLPTDSANGGMKQQVEQIYGWRYPLTDQEKAEER